MTQVLASYRSVEADFVSIQASSSQQSLAVLAKNNSPSSLLNKQESQLADEVSISPEAIEKFEEARRLQEFLDSYLSYLKGDSESELPKIGEVTGEPTAVITGRSTNLSASITAGRIREETLEVAADIDDEGNVNSLTITKTETTVEFVRAELTLEDTQFYAAINS